MKERARSLLAWMYGPDHAPIGLILWNAQVARYRRKRWLRQIRDPRNWR